MVIVAGPEPQLITNDNNDGFDIDDEDDLNIEINIPQIITNADKERIETKKLIILLTSPPGSLRT